MNVLQESYLYHLAVLFAAAYRESTLCRILSGMGDWCQRQIAESRILCALCHEGRVAGSWKSSLTCRGLSWLVNLPISLLHRLYRALQPLFDQSVFARLGFAMGDSTAIAESWLIMILWIIPFSHWNNAYTMMGFVLILALFHVGAMHRADFRMDVGNIGFYPLVLFGAMFLGVAFSYAPGLSARFLLYHISAALCVLATVSAVRSTGDLKRLAAGGSVCVMVSSLYGVFQRIQGVEVNESYVDMKLNAGMPGRVESFFDNPNTFAEVLILLLPLVLALIFCSRSRWGKLASCGIFLVGAAALGMTYSRASWVGMAFAVVVLVFLWKPRLLPLLFLAGVACIPLLPQTIWNRILTIGNPADTSTASRIPLYQAAIEVIKTSPVSGGGLGTAATQAFIRDMNLYHARAPFVHAHNFYLQVWIEAGLLGITGFLGSMLWNIKRAAGAVRSTADSAARTITCAAAASLCGAMVCGLADYLWNYPRVMCIFWFVFAMALAGTKLCLKEQEEKA